MTTDTKSIEERRKEVLARQEEVRAELRGLEEERRALAPEVADGHEEAEQKGKEIAERISVARERLVVYEMALEELSRREEAELAAAEEAAREELRVKYDYQADRRAVLEAQAQADLEALDAILEELDAVDTEQRWLSGDLGMNQSRFPLDFIVNNWLGSRLAPYMSGVTAKPEFLKPLSELNPLDPRATRPAEVEAAREREALEASGRAEQDRLEHEALGRSFSLREKYEALMGRFMGVNSEERRRHEREFVVPALVREFGVEEVRAALVGYESAPIEAAAEGRS